MRPLAGLALAAALCGPANVAAAQEATVAVTEATGAVLRALDRVSGELVDIELLNGQSAAHGYLDITVSSCRFPTDNPSSDSFVHVTILDRRQDGAAFEGWMVASSPALNALDHPRYDVWVMRCIRE